MMYQYPDNLLVLCLLLGEDELLTVEFEFFFTVLDQLGIFRREWMRHPVLVNAVL